MMSESDAPSARCKALKFTRISDGAVYVFLKESETLWTRTDRSDIQLACAGGCWYVTTASDPSQRFGRPAQEDNVTATEPPAGRWLSAKAGKSYEYELEHLDCGCSPLAEEYAAQERLRNWDAMLETVAGVLRADSCPAGSAPSIATFYDLGSGAGPISRRILAAERPIIVAERLISADLDPVMVARSCWDGRQVSGNGNPMANSASFRVADLTDLFGKSNYPLESWKARCASTPAAACTKTNAKANVVWSSFCTAYFPKPGAVLRSWAEHLLDKDCGLMALVEIQGLFSAHGYAENDGSERPTRRRRLNELFLRADGAVQHELHNDVFVGKKLEDIVKTELGDVLEIAHTSEWVDLELAFDGKAEAECLEQWRKRLHREGIQRAIRGIDCEGIDSEGKTFSERFLECLQSEAHICRGKVKMVILRRI